MDYLSAGNAYIDTLSSSSTFVKSISTGNAYIGLLSSSSVFANTVSKNWDTIVSS
jgi:hypothetical protein